MMENYDKLVERISKSSKLSIEEIERKVEAKKAKLSGLISKEGAAQIVAAEMGINLDMERLKLSEIFQGMKRANVVGKIIEILSIREYNKNGRAGKVANLRIADDSGNARVVLWDTNHISLIEQGKIKKDDVVELANANVRNGELHLSSFSDIKLSSEQMNVVISEKVFEAEKLKDIKAGQNVKIRAIIVQAFEPRYFEVCPECKKRALDGECKIHGKVSPLKRALLNIVLDDGSSTIRSVLFGENINTLGFTDEEIFSLEKFAEKKSYLLGEERIFYGNAKNNALYNTIEFTIENSEVVDIDVLVKELEQKTQ
jgi:ssDNA-binding replication factor A large subunit